jgi:hypothetical protein
MDASLVLQAGGFRYAIISSLFPFYMLLVNRTSDGPCQLHGTAHISLACTITLLAFNSFRKLYPPIGLVVNFVLTFLYLAGLTGVAAFSFALNLVSKCDTWMGCIAYKIAFFTAHVSGYVILSAIEMETNYHTDPSVFPRLPAWAMILLDAYVWGQSRASAAGYRRFDNDAGLLPSKASAYEPTRH